jgi:hypothetical protein
MKRVEYLEKNELARKFTFSPGVIIEIQGIAVINET